MKLEELLSPKRIANIVADPNRNIAEKDEISYLKDARPVVGVDPDTGDLFRLGTPWADPQVFDDVALFNNGIRFPQALPRAITFDTDLDTYIYSTLDDNMFFRVGGYTYMGFNPGMFMYGTVNMLGNGFNNCERIQMDERASIPTPPASHLYLYNKIQGGTNHLYFKSDDGTDHEVASV